jgi:hypothetical protein
MRTYARMRRLAFQRARERARARARDGDLHIGITVRMHIMICTRVRMYTCMRALAECILARVGVGVDAGARARRERVSTNCVSLRTLYIDVYLCMNVGTYGCIIACL